MDDACEKIREQIPELIGTGLSAEKAVELEQHRSQCQACNEYFEALEADDRLLCEFARAMQTSVARLENVAMDRLGRRPSSGTIQTISPEAGILSGRVARVAAAALIVTAILVGAVMLRRSGEKPVEIVGQSGESGVLVTEAPNLDKPDLTAITEAELQEIQRMIAASDLAGLKAMLSEGQPRSKIAAANFLATTGDAHLIGELAQLAAEWQGDAARNPFAAAIAEIVTSLQEQRSSDTGDDDDDRSTAATASSQSQEETACRGIVVDERGRGVADARVLLYHNRSRWGLGNRIVEETVTTEDGAFVCKRAAEFSSVRGHSYAQNTYILMATHPDYAFGWRNITQGSEQASYRLVLTSPVTQTVTVTDHDGNPLAGVRVWPYSAGSRESPNAVFRDYLTLPTDVGLAGGTTDAEGQAVIANLPDVACRFRATVKGYAGGLAFSADSTIRLRRGASVSGWVLDEADKPVAGATVRFAAKWMHNYFLAMSDNEGYFHLVDLPARGWDQSPWGNSGGASGSYTVTLKHDQCAAEPTEVTLLPGQSIDDFLIEASSDTTLVECRVVEFGTDVPIAGARIMGSNRIGKIDGFSDANAIFKVRVLPGPVSLSFYFPPDGVYVLRDHMSIAPSLNFDATGERMAVTLKAPPIGGFLRSVPGIVLGPDGLVQSEGETIVHAAAGGLRTSTQIGYVQSVGVDGDGYFELKDAPAGRKLSLYVATKDRTLAAADVFDIPDDPNWSGYHRISLRATQKASVIVNDIANNVVSDRDLTVSPMVGGERIALAERSARTDENGLLEIDGIVPGLEYYLSSAEPEGRARLTSSSLEARSREVTLKMVLIPVEPE